jgi:hypothetical protein
VVLEKDGISVGPIVWVSYESKIVHTAYRRKANWIGHILRGNCLIKHVIEGKIEGRI